MSARLRFLIDENVKVELKALLNSNSFDFVVAQRPDELIAQMSLEHKLVLLTNDKDFMQHSLYSKAYCVIVIRFEQDDASSLVSSFLKHVFILKPEEFEGKAFLLNVDGLSKL